MITLIDSIEIKTAPEHVYNWLISLKTGKDYRAWHPGHVDWIWIQGEPFQIGSVVYSEEYLHGEMHKLKFACTNIIPNRLVEYKPLFPWSIIMLSSSFAIESKSEDDSIFTATLNFRSFPLIDKVLKNQLEGTRLHMKEEGENLKKILEGK